MEVMNEKKSNEIKNTNPKHMMIRGERLDDINSILIESKFENGIYYDEVSIQNQYVTFKADSVIINDKTYFSGVHPVAEYAEVKLGSHITYDNEGLKGWIEYNKQYVAFIEFSPETGKRKVVKLFDVGYTEFIDGLNCELEQLYKQSFATNIMVHQEQEIPVKKLELKK